MTHPTYQGQGFGKAVVSKALKHAWSSGCHHVLMQSGRADPRVHAFYQQLGFQGGLRVGYVAMQQPE
ncbi:Acetyltransferase (GNAT) family protein [Sphingomonas carotinifaciens]|nr:Acetyltransferase (GNAT) family protein [Sphingomonas carotinifaciens]